MAKQAKVLSVINYKGGVGKTTLTLQLGLGLNQLKGARVLLVDLDPQCSLSVSTVEEHFWIDWIEKKGSIRSVVQTFYQEDPARIEPDWIIEKALNRTWENMPGELEGLDLLPSHLDLPDYEMKLVAKKPKWARTMEEFNTERYLLLQKALEPLKSQYDYILFDCPPNIYLISRNAIVASDYYLVPTIPDFISCYGIPFILEHIKNMQEDVRERGAHCNAQLLGIVRNRVRFFGGHMAHEHQEQSDKLQERYGDALMEQCINDRMGVAELLGSRKNIFKDETKKNEEVRREFTELVEAVLKRID